MIPWDEVVAGASELLDRPLTTLGPTARGESGSTLRVRDSTDVELIIKVLADHATAIDDQRRLLRIVAALRDTGYPAPEHLGVGRTGELVFNVQRVLPGDLLEPAPGVRSDAALLDRVVPQVLDVVELQRDAGDLAAPPWPGWLLDTIERGGDGYCLHGTMRRRADTSQLLDRLIALARRHAVGPCRNRDVVHFDLNPANLLHVDGWLTGIVDWNVPFAGAAQGDRGFDVATLLFYLYDHEPSRRRLWDVAIATSGPDWVTVYLCHLVLRQVEWSVRHRAGSDEEDRYLRIAQEVLDGLG